MKGFVYCSSKLIFFFSLLFEKKRKKRQKKKKSETRGHLRPLDSWWKPQLNSREAPTWTQVNTGGRLLLLFFFFFFLLSFSTSIHLNSRKYRFISSCAFLNHGLSVCESVSAKKVTQVGSISPAPELGQNVSLFFFFCSFCFFKPF